MRTWAALPDFLLVESQHHIQYMLSVYSLQRQQDRTFGYKRKQEQCGVLERTQASEPTHLLMCGSRISIMGPSDLICYYEGVGIELIPLEVNFSNILT